MRTKAASCVRVALSAGVSLAGGARLAATGAAGCAALGAAAPQAAALRHILLGACASQHGDFCPAAQRRGYSATGPPPGADLAQHIFSVPDPSNLADATAQLAALPPAGLPAVARAAALSGVTDRAFVTALVDVAVRGLPSLPPADLCTVMESLAELGAYSVAFKDATAKQILARLHEFTGDMLGHTLRSFAAMSYYDDELLEAVVAHAAEQSDKFSAENISDVVYALSKCGFCHPSLVAITERAGRLLLEEATFDRGEALANIIDAYSRVGCSEPEVMDTLVARASASAGDLSGTALAKLVVGTIRLGYDDLPTLEPLLDALTGKLGELSPKAVVKVVGSLGECALCHRSLLDAITDQVLPSRLGEFHASGLSDLVNSLNKLGYYNPGLMALIQGRQMRSPAGGRGAYPEPAAA